MQPSAGVSDAFRRAQEKGEIECKARLAERGQDHMALAAMMGLVVDVAGSR